MSLDDESRFAERLAASPYSKLLNKQHTLERELNGGRRLTIIDDDEGTPVVFDSENLRRGVAKCALAVYVDSLYPAGLRREIIGIRVVSDLRALGKGIRRGLNITSRVLRAAEKKLPQD